MNTRPTRKFCVRYYHDGGWWGILLDAYDMEDAEVRCRKLGMQLDGILLFTLPGWLPFGGLIVGCICHVRNFFHNLTRP
jgi:hypothetical protein